MLEVYADSFQVQPAHERPVREKLLQGGLFLLALPLSSQRCWRKSRKSLTFPEDGCEFTLRCHVKNLRFVLIVGPITYFSTANLSLRRKRVWGEGLKELHMRYQAIHKHAPNRAVDYSNMSEVAFLGVFFYDKVALHWLAMFIPHPNCSFFKRAMPGLTDFLLSKRWMWRDFRFVALPILARWLCRKPWEMI